MVETAKSQIPNEEKKKITAEESASNKLLALSRFKSSRWRIKSRINLVIKALFVATIKTRIRINMDIRTRVFINF